MRRPLVTAVTLLLLGGGLAAAPAGAEDHSDPPAPAAHHVRSVPAVGALYYPSVKGSSPDTGGRHFCSASVLHSATHDLVITAGHCVYGTGASIEFAPMVHDDKLPAGVWEVTAIYVDPAWITSFDPRHDVAILRVAPQDGKDLEDVVPGRPLAEPRPGRKVKVTGYPMSAGGRPLTCAVPLRDVRGYSGVMCRGFGAGTSGGPWVQRGRLVGVIGGLEQGGCAPDVEYSTPFGGPVRALLARAVAGGRGDVVPVGFTANAC